VQGTPDYAGLGPRVPLVAISRWAKPHYVSHVPHDHTSVMRFIETIFDLPALTGRDANADALMDLFDFSCSQPASPPPAPAAGTGGCPQGVIPDPDLPGAL
jgi:phospholipase C